MEILLVLLCCGSIVITTALGLGVTFVLERFLGGLAYIAGAVLPIVGFTVLYTLYHIYIRSTPCEPAGGLACGEPFLTAFFLFVGVAFFLLIANILAQTSLYLFLYGRRQAIPAALYEEYAPESGDASGAEPGTPADTDQEMGGPASAVVEETEPVAEMPSDEQYLDESEFSGLPPDAPEDEPRRDPT